MLALIDVWLGSSPPSVEGFPVPCRSCQRGEDVSATILTVAEDARPAS